MSGEGGGLERDLSHLSLASATSATSVASMASLASAASAASGVSAASLTSAGCSSTGASECGLIVGVGVGVGMSMGMGMGMGMGAGVGVGFPDACVGDAPSPCSSCSPASAGSPCSPRGERPAQCKQYTAVCMGRMHAHLHNNHFCDVVLIANGHRFPAHRLVLSSASEYFSAMFTGQLIESTQNEITLENVEVEAMQALIPYCYTGIIDLQEETVENILSAARLLQLNAVVNACCDFLQQQLHPSNCLGIAMFAEQQSCLSLQMQASEYTRQNFMEVYKNQEFLKLSLDQLAELLKSDDLNVTSEEHVFESMMTWFMYDQLNREKFLHTLLEYVKLPLLSPVFLFDQVKKACSKIVKCQPLIMEALEWHLLPERRQQLSSNRTDPRKSTMCKILAVGGMDVNKSNASIEIYDPCTNSWSMFMKMAVRRLQFGVAVIKDKLVLIGGRDGLRTLNTVDCIDLKSMTTTALSPLQTQRHGLSVAVMGDGPNAPVYAVGGHDGWSYINTVERWDPASRTWSYVAPMNGQRSTCGVGVLEGKLYAVGGRDGSACLRSVEAYCPHTNKWKQCASMNKRRGGVGVAVVGGYLYALGGHDAPAKNSTPSMYSCVERYDPALNIWIMVGNLSGGRDGIGTCLLGDKLVAVGGYDGTEYLRNVEQYDAQTKEWRPLSSLNIGRAGACVVPMPLSLRKRKTTE
ncbi:kelch-like protein 5 [Arctopsyche grandis]|uniref:kelch-like protein 5 n=1 Tax=Arctopsyche grandis TaxID=121162 RepID=UPI00406D954B